MFGQLLVRNVHYDYERKGLVMGDVNVFDCVVCFVVGGAMGMVIMALLSAARVETGEGE